MSNKQTRGGASIKVVPWDIPNQGTYPETNLGPLTPQSLSYVEHRHFFLKLKLNFRRCLANKLEGVPA